MPVKLSSDHQCKYPTWGIFFRDQAQIFKNKNERNYTTFRYHLDIIFK